jgi:hypothetical protein
MPPEAEGMGQPGEMTFGEAATELGFHSDIDYLPIDGALPRHRALWLKFLPDHLEERHARFMTLADDIRRVAFVEGLRQNRQRSRTGRTRAALVREIREKAWALNKADESDEE